MAQLLHSDERAPGTQWIGCWVGSKTGLDVMAKIKILAPARNGILIVQPVT